MPDLFKIGYDARMIHHSGIGVRIQHLLKYLLRNNQNRFKFYLFGSKEKLKEFENIEILSFGTKFKIYAPRAIKAAIVTRTINLK